MPAKALNKANLAALGPERLAELLIEVTKGKADKQRLLRLELSAHQGPDDVARDIRKRYASLRQAKGYLPRKTHRALAKEIDGFTLLIEKNMAPEAAFDLLWELLHLAPGILGRTKDMSGTLAAAFDTVMTAVARAAPDAKLRPEALADTVIDALRHDRTGTFAQAVPALRRALGPKGLDHLQSAAEAEPHRSNGWTGPLLLQIADAKGDIDAYIARLGPARLRNPPFAIDAATRLCSAGRADEAVEILTRAKDRIPSRAWEDAYAAALDAAGRREELKPFLLAAFAAQPDAGRLRQYLRLLPDFDDIEAEDNARTLAAQHPSAQAALRFFIDWPDLGAADALVRTRHDDLVGDTDGFALAADRLEPGHPLSSALLRRLDARASLSRGTAAGDRQAALQVLACMATDAMIADYGDFPDHSDFIAALRKQYPRRRGFWAKVT